MEAVDAAVPSPRPPHTEKLKVVEAYSPPAGLAYSHVDYTHPYVRLDDGEAAVVRIHIFAPEVRAPRAVIVFNHGMSEFGLRYAHVYAQWAARGYAVVAPDQSGCGVSEGPPNLCMTIEHWVSVFLTARRVALQRFIRTPLILAGHSLGGLTCSIVSRLLPDSADGFVLFSPALRLPISTVAGLMLRIIPESLRLTLQNPQNGDDVVLSALDEAHVTDDVDDLLAPPAPYQTIHSLFVAGNQVREEEEEASPPILGVMGTDDALCRYEALSEFLQREDGLQSHSGFEDITLRGRNAVWTLPNYGHETLREPRWKEIAEHVGDWVEHEVLPTRLYER